MRTYQRKENGERQKYPDKMSELIDQVIAITEIEMKENKFGECAIVTYENEKGEIRKAQTNSEVLIKLFQEQKEEGLPFQTVVREVKSNKSRYYFYTLGEPGAE